MGRAEEEIEGSAQGKRHVSGESEGREKPGIQHQDDGDSVGGQ